MVRVPTPLGSLVVKQNYESEHPGIWIDLSRDGFDCDMPLVYVEFDPNYYGLDCPEGSIVTRV